MSVIVKTSFEKAPYPDCLSWCVGGEPKATSFQGDSNGLVVTPKGKTDFWQKTYYTPDISKCNGSLLAVPIEKDQQVVAEASFTLNTINQFDQAGLMIYVDEKHWLKAGLEFSDGQCLMGCVVTNEFSDWSVRPWTSSSLSLRVYKLSNSIVVEAQQAGGSWQMVRLAYLNMDAAPQCRVGLYTCAPTEEGTSTCFHSLSVKECSGYHHHA